MSIAREPFTSRDVVIALSFMAMGLAVRVLLWSGYGLGDDPILRGQFNAIHHGGFIADNQGYRITWLLPTLLSTRVFGISELGLILPVTIVSTLGIGVVYAVGHQLYGRAGAVVAGLLIAVHPFDVVWATMFTSDYFCSVASAITMWCVLRATSHADVDVRRRAWIGAVVALVAAYHAKVSAAVLVVPIAAILVMRRRELGRELWTAVVWGAGVGGAVLLVYTALAGNPLAPLELEVRFQGLSGPNAIHRLATWNTFEIYPRQLFQRGPTGDLVYGLYPHVFVVLLLGGWLLRLRTAGEALWWLATVFLAMELNVQRAEGHWVAGFRNVRHLHGIAYPLVLVIAGYLASLWHRWPRVAAPVVGVLAAVSLAQAVSLANGFGPTFRDRAAVVAFLKTQPPARITGDVALHMRWQLDQPSEGAWRFTELGDNPTTRAAQIANITDGYVVTGTGQEPYYGCYPCVIRAAELPPDRFELLLELPGSDGDGPPWRPERARVWKLKASSGSG